jgi:hypothetical protein
VYVPVHRTHSSGTSGTGVLVHATVPSGPPIGAR